MSDNARTYHRDVSDSIEIETRLIPHLSLKKRCKIRAKSIVKGKHSLF